MPATPAIAYRKTNIVNSNSIVNSRFGQAGDYWNRLDSDFSS
jgi:hypothetical protein